MTHRIMLVAVATAMLLACASTPQVYYYTLDMEPSGRSETTCAVDVAAFRVVDALARQQLLIQASPTSIEYYAVDEWAGNVGELVSRKLAAELGAGRGDDRVVGLTGMVLECGQLDLGAGAEATMAIQIVARTTDGRTILKKAYRARHAAARASAKAVVEALSRCAEDIAAEVSSDLEEVCVVE